MQICPCAELQLHISSFRIAVPTSAHSSSAHRYHLGRIYIYQPCHKIYLHVKASCWGAECISILLLLLASTCPSLQTGGLQAGAFFFSLPGVALPLLKVYEIRIHMD
jgi:hypothetical protein